MIDRADIFVSVPSLTGVPCFETAQCLRAMYRYMQKKGYVIAEQPRRGASVVRHRNEAVAKALRMNSKWILFIDADMVFDDCALTTLIDHKKPIVSGMYFAKQPPHVPVAGMSHKDGGYMPIDDWPEDELIEVDAVGAGFLLIETEVFNKVKRPWFVDRYDGTADNVGEDYYFCKKAKIEGYEIYLDTRVQLGHVGPYIFSINDYKVYKDLNNDKLEEKGGQSVNTEQNS